MSADDPATIDAVAAAIHHVWTFEAEDDEDPAREIARALAEAGWLNDPADRAKIDRLQKSVDKAEEFFTEHDIADWVELGRIIEGSRIRARRVLTPTDQAVPTRDELAEAMQWAWDEFCTDTGCFPDCFEWRGGNGRLWARFDRGNFADYVRTALVVARRDRFDAAVPNARPPVRQLDDGSFVTHAGHTEKVEQPKAVTAVLDNLRTVRRRAAVGGSVPADPPAAVPFNDANVGDEVFTWQVADGHDWGDYLFETVDPAETGADDMESDVVRKRWRLVEVVRIPSPWSAGPQEAKP